MNRGVTERGDQNPQIKSSAPLWDTVYDGLCTNGTGMFGWDLFGCSLNNYRAYFMKMFNRIILA
jgi:hypothetical protein